LAASSNPLLCLLQFLYKLTHDFGIYRKLYVGIFSEHSVCRSKLEHVSTVISTFTM